MMKLIFIFFIVGNCGLANSTTIEYIYNGRKTSWDNALRYCREYYSDLPSFQSTEEQQQLVNIFPEKYRSVWIGLFKPEEESNWYWSDGQPVLFLSWSSGYPQTDYYYSYLYSYCTVLYNGQWKNFDCQNSFPFYCYRYLILVNEKKTWEEALQYCTTNYTGLASLPDGTQVSQAQKEIALTQTVNVWTGLRFMNGNWFWLSGESTEDLDFLPSCPAQPYHCGALKSTANVWENQDCSDKLNFLCYKK